MKVAVLFALLSGVCAKDLMKPSSFADFHASMLMRRLASHTGGGGGDCDQAAAGAKFAAIEAACAKDCTEDDSAVTADMPKCGDGQEERGVKCKGNAACSDAMAAITDGDAECLGPLIGGASMVSWFAIDLNIKCDASYTITLPSACKMSQMKYLMTNQLDKDCKKDCADSSSEAKEKGIPECAEGAIPFGEKCKTATCEAGMANVDVGYMDCMEGIFGEAAKTMLYSEKSKDEMVAEMNKMKDTCKAPGSADGGASADFAAGIAPKMMGMLAASVAYLLI